ncbi:MAG: hypothetical protein KIS61_31610 [Candidatus Eremiobacteraeota bacterium]|nr:hypothetical protein [Candidatus Eremiobacteraeota bacterium]
MKNLKDSGKYHFVMPSAGKNELASNDMSKRLLCAGCESLLSKFEGYAADRYKEWLGFSGSNFSAQVPVDYVKTKLFLLSLAWRCSIASGLFYSGVSLEPEVAEDFRGRILSGTPGGDLEYPMTAMLEASGKLKRSLRTPRTTSFNAGGRDYPFFTLFAAGVYFGVILTTDAANLADLARLMESGYWSRVEHLSHYSNDQNFMAAGTYVGWRAPGTRYG